MKEMMKGKIMKKLKTTMKKTNVGHVNLNLIKPENFFHASKFDFDLNNLFEKIPMKSNLIKSQPSNPPPQPISALCQDSIKTQQERKPQVIFDDEDDKENIKLPPCHSSSSSSCISRIPAPKRDYGSSDRNSADSSRNIGFDEAEAPPPPPLPPPLSEIDFTSFRRPDMESSTLFDPNLLAAFQQAVIEATQQLKESNSTNSYRNGSYGDQILSAPPKSSNIGVDETRLSKTEDSESDSIEYDALLEEFEEKCPPGGANSVILYTTSLRGIRKTFDSCQSIRFLLDSFRLVYRERDISIHSDFKQELWKTLGEGEQSQVSKKFVPPRLFIKGRYIGGAEEVLSLHEQGKFKPLLRGIPIYNVDEEGCNEKCDGCGGFRFVVCFHCDGSKKVFDDEERIEKNGATFVVGFRKCSECNENGLIICPFCC